MAGRRDAPSDANRPLPDSRRAGRGMGQVTLGATLIRAGAAVGLVVGNGMSDVRGLGRGALMTVVVKQCGGKPLDGHPQRKQKGDEPKHGRGWYWRVRGRRNRFRLPAGHHAARFDGSRELQPGLADDCTARGEGRVPEDEPTATSARSCRCRTHRGRQQHGDVPDRVVARAQPYRAHVRIALPERVQEQRHADVDCQSEYCDPGHCRRVGRDPAPDVRQRDPEDCDAVDRHRPALEQCDATAPYRRQCKGAQAHGVVRGVAEEVDRVGKERGGLRMPGGAASRRTSMHWRQGRSRERGESHRHPGRAGHSRSCSSRTWSREAEILIASIENPDVTPESSEDGQMQIGELAKLAETPVETIRYYEKIGLLPPPARTSGNYGAIRRARSSGCASSGDVGASTWRSRRSDSSSRSATSRTDDAMTSTRCWTSTSASWSVGFATCKACRAS